MANNTQILLFSGAGALMLWLAWRTPKSSDSSNLSDVLRWRDLINRASVRHNLPPEIIGAVIWQESGGDPNARGAAGEKGLMQVKDIAAREVGFDEASYDPETNATQGSALLSKIVGLTGNMFDSLRAYNKVGTNIAGLNAVEGSGYATEVLEKAEILHEKLGTPTDLEFTAINAQGGFFGLAEEARRRVTGFFEELF